MKSIYAYKKCLKEGHVWRNVGVTGHVDKDFKVEPMAMNYLYECSKCGIIEYDYRRRKDAVNDGIVKELPAPTYRELKKTLQTSPAAWPPDEWDNFTTRQKP